MKLVSTTRPGRMRCIQKPMNRAIGMVMATEKVPHGECARALTTTRASTPSRMIMMAKTASSAAAPPARPISSRAICPSDVPSRRMDRNSTTMSCTAPAKITPATIHSVPGRYPIWAASTGPTSGPAPAMAAKWWPRSTRLSVGWKSTPSSRRSAGVARRSSGFRTRRAMNRE